MSDAKINLYLEDFFRECIENFRFQTKISSLRTLGKLKKLCKLQCYEIALLKFLSKLNKNFTLPNIFGLLKIKHLILIMNFKLPSITINYSYGSLSRYILKTCDVKFMFNFNY
ncbi:hypothetical protein BpHYR1_008863 [Brachionus plicatilis]|uniref:Uncharacterized protein n=1 Tax=Brachionus plicatilis TaxID=10195 RepID=A0A3M7Q1E3_BRAPC|nr:hypothetical protein BpHYR1_008863 [Brachionus plicatilis]